MDAKKILIICYSFPPFPGIGGRRWAKFAKYFAGNGIQCHIINAYNYSETESLWNKDVENPNIIIHPLKFKFQYWMGLNSKKIGYRIIAKLLRTAINLTKYSPYFSTSLSRKLLLRKCAELIQKHDIDTVIASGDPYLQCYATELKKKCNVKVILDYRDLWNDYSQYNQNKYHRLTSKQRLFFEFSEKESLKNCDTVVCVYEPMINVLTARGGKNKKHFHIIPNGFDRPDYPHIKTNFFQNKKITLYFGGSISGERADYFTRFLKSYSKLHTSAKQLWEQFCININGNSSYDFEEELKTLNNPNIAFQKELLSITKYIEKLNASNFGILSVNDEYADCLFITKVYDYLYLEKPMIYLGKKGKVSEFIEENGIGFAFNPEEEAESFFEKLLKNSTGLKYAKEVHDKIEQEYDVKNLSAKYLDLLSKK